MADPINRDAPNTIAGNTLKYDKDGNLTKYAGNPFTWDYRNRLTSIFENGATSTYAYDFQNNRVKRVVGTSTPVMTLYPSDLYNVSSSTAIRNVFTNDGTLVATISGTSTLATAYIHPDNLGSTNVTTDSSGTLSETSDYYPYGSQRLDTGTTQQRKYIGEEYDPESSLSYLNARYYEGARGQFLSQDPQFWSSKQNLQDPQSLNAYSYADDNPIIKKDPSGRFLEDFGIGEAIIGIGYLAVANMPEITSFLESLATPLGQTAVYNATNDVHGGNYVLAGIDIATAGDTQIPHVMPEEARAMLQADSKLCEGVCGVSTLPSLEEISSANRAFASSFETDAGKKIASSMFREGDQFPGGTAAALRFEAQTGSFLSPSGHGIKAQNMLNQFNNALSNGILSPNDIARLSPKLDELSSALKSFSSKFNK